MIKEPFLESNNRMRLLYRANQLRQEGEYAASLLRYMQVLQQFGEDADLLGVIANCYFNIASDPGEGGDNLSASVVWMEKAVALRPEDGRLHTILGDYYALAINDYQCAAEEYRIAMQLNPWNIRAFIAGASLYGVPEDVVTLDETTAWLERAAYLDPDEPHNHFRLGSIYRKAGRLEDAERSWVRALLCHRPLEADLLQFLE